jgi:peptidoglycan hydrolase-like protein with peptidoglycan-binding domain
MDVNNLDLPVSSKWIRLDELHPRFKYRLGAFFEDGQIRGKVVICSGVRTMAQQQALYDKYKAGKGNLAANPSRVFGGGFQGSWHMVQPAMGNYGYAVDFRIRSGADISTWEVNNIARTYGCARTVPSEWWHHQPFGRTPVGDWGWFDAPALKGDKQEEGLVKVRHPLEEIALAIKRARAQVLRRGSRGDAVKLLQMCLQKQGIACARSSKHTRAGRGIDGIFGWGTERAVRRFQGSEACTPDGVVGPATWAALFE